MHHHRRRDAAELRRIREFLLGLCREVRDKAVDEGREPCCPDCGVPFTRIFGPHDREGRQGHPQNPSPDRFDNDNPFYGPGLVCQIRNLVRSANTVEGAYSFKMAPRSNKDKLVESAKGCKSSTASYPSLNILQTPLSPRSPPSPPAARH